MQISLFAGVRIGELNANFSCPENTTVQCLIMSVIKFWSDKILSFAKRTILAVGKIWFELAKPNLIIQ